MIRHLLKMVWNRRRSNALLSVEVFFSFLVLFLVVVFGVYFADNYRQPLGFDYQNVLTVDINTNDKQVQPEDRKARTLRNGLASEAMLRELKSMPEIDSVGGTWSQVYSNSQWDTSVNYKNRSVMAYRDYATADTAKALGIQVERGRWFSAEDDAAQYVPMVVNRKFAASLFAGDDPLGKLVEEGEKGEQDHLQDLRRNRPFQAGRRTLR